MSHKISIIVPVYNVEKYVGNCITSLLNQTYKNVEIILIDDGSLDSSGEICDEYAREDDRIKVIHQKNAGVSTARNRGIEAATGDYIGFVDSDDYVSKEMYEHLLSVCLNNNVDIAQCDRIYTDKLYTEREKIVNTSEKVYIIKRQKALHELLCSQSVRSSLWSKLYKKELFDGVRLDTRLVAGEDGIANYQLISKTDKIAVSEKACYYYYQRSGSCTTGSLNEKIYKSIGIIQNYAKFEKNKELKKSWKFNIALKAINYLRRAIVQNKLENFKELRLYVTAAKCTLLQPHKYKAKKEKFISLHFLLVWLTPWLYIKIILLKNAIKMRHRFEK